MNAKPQTVDLTGVKYPDPMDLKSAALYLGLTDMRVRTLAREGRIEAGKVDGAWSFAKAALDKYKATPRRRGGGTGPRGEGKAWIVRVKHADLPKVRDALKQYGIELQPRYNYEAQKEYRAKRAAKLAAEKKAKIAAQQPPRITPDPKS